MKCEIFRLVGVYEGDPHYYYVGEDNRFIFDRYFVRARVLDNSGEPVRVYKEREVFIDWRDYKKLRNILCKINSRNYEYRIREGLIV